MGIVDRVLDTLEQRRQTVLEGDINSIPTPFKRFSDDFIGIEQGRYVIVTSTTKTGKSMFSSYLFIYNTLIYAYNHPDKARVKIFYYPLEETPEQVTCRFMSFLLYCLSNKQIIVSPVDLMSSKNIAIDSNILELLNSDEYKKILKFFEECVIFSDNTTPSDVWFECQRYAKENGTIYKTKITYKDELGIEKEGERFDHYEANDPKEYRIVFFDHIGLVQSEKGMDLRQSMTKLSEYFVLLRNRYNFTIVAIQQQTMTSDNLDAIKANKLRPSLSNIGDAKTLARDADCCIGLFSPYRYELSKYPTSGTGYDITKFKDKIRFVEILINRHGQSNGMAALLFLGQCNYWAELPPPTDAEGLSQIYKYLDSISKDSLFKKASSFITITLNKIRNKLKL